MKCSFSRPRFLADDEVRRFEQGEVLGDRLARHVEALGELARGLSVQPMEAIQQQPPDRIRQRPKDRVHAHGGNMQPFGCLFKRKFGGAGRLPGHAVSGATIASSSLTTSCGLSRACKPRWPPLTKT